MLSALQTTLLNYVVWRISPCVFIILYAADDIMLLAAYSTDGFRTWLKTCRCELDQIYMVIISCCMRIGPRYNTAFALISNCSGTSIARTDTYTIRHLGIAPVRSRTFKIMLSRSGGQIQITIWFKSWLNHIYWIVQCFTSPSTQYRLYGRGFSQVKRSNQQYQSTEGDATKEKENNENN